MDLFEEVTSLLPATADAFCRRYPHPFLVRKPRSLFQGSPAELSDTTLEYHTQTVKRESDGLLPWQFWIIEVKKKPTNPFPDHVTIGRAPNCDVVLRFPFVSKLHARFLLKEGSPWAIEDCGSSNGLLLNGERLEPGCPRELAPGARIGFANLVVDYVCPEGLFELVRSRRQG